MSAFGGKADIAVNFALSRPAKTPVVVISPMPSPRRFPPPWSVEELDYERRGRSASPPSSWAVSRNRHHMSIVQYCNIRAAWSVLFCTPLLNLVGGEHSACFVVGDRVHPRNRHRPTFARRC